MKKKLAKSLILLLILALLLPGGTLAAESRILRVGLNYGNDCVVVGNLKNIEQTGFRFGYYDADRSFIPLGWTGETRIIVMITQNLYLTSGGIYVYESENTVGVVGCYHVQLPGSYGDFDSALAAAATAEGGFVAWISGAYYVRMGSYARRSEAEAAVAALGIEGATVGETSGYGYSAVATGTTRILFQFDVAQSGEQGAFGVQPGLEAEGKAVTEFKKQGSNYYGGFRFERIGGGESTVVNIVEMDDYIKGVIPYEMSPSWPLEALKAQAVAARSYAIYNMQASRHSREHHFDLCTTTDCQVYYGINRANDVTDRAVDETAGQLALYNGKAIQAVYSSSHGGASESAKNVWGGEIPYLQGVIDPYEADVADKISGYYWTKTITADEVKQRLHEKGYTQCADVVKLTPHVSETGNTISITVTDSKGTNFTFSREKLGNVIGSYRCRHFTLETSGGGSVQTTEGYPVTERAEPIGELAKAYAISGDGKVSVLSGNCYAITGEGVSPLEKSQVAMPGSGGDLVFTLNGAGWGHSVGMSQWGAYAMAQRGMSYLDILHFYYTDITVE